MSVHIIDLVNITKKKFPSKLLILPNSFPHICTKLNQTTTKTWIEHSCNFLKYIQFRCFNIILLVFGVFSHIPISFQVSHKHLTFCIYLLQWCYWRNNRAQIYIQIASSGLVNMYFLQMCRLPIVLTISGKYVWWQSFAR